jgi:hypothetical protein
LGKKPFRLLLLRRWASNGQLLQNSPRAETQQGYVVEFDLIAHFFFVLPQMFETKLKTENYAFFH